MISINYPALKIGSVTRDMDLTMKLLTKQMAISKLYFFGRETKIGDTLNKCIKLKGDYKQKKIFVLQKGPCFIQDY